MGGKCFRRRVLWEGLKKPHCRMEGNLTCLSSCVVRCWLSICNVNCRSHNWSKNAQMGGEIERKVESQTETSGARVWVGILNCGCHNWIKMRQGMSEKFCTLPTDRLYHFHIMWCPWEAKRFSKVWGAFIEVGSATCSRASRRLVIERTSLGPVMSSIWCGGRFLWSSCEGARLSLPRDSNSFVPTTIMETVPAEGGLLK